MFSFVHPQRRHVNLLNKSRSSFCIIKSSLKFEYVVTNVFDDIINLKTFAFPFPAMDLEEPYPEKLCKPKGTFKRLSMIYLACWGISISSKSTLTGFSSFRQVYRFQCTNFHQSMRGLYTNRSVSDV